MPDVSAGTSLENESGVVAASKFKQGALILLVPPSFVSCAHSVGESYMSVRKFTMSSLDDAKKVASSGECAVIEECPSLNAIEKFKINFSLVVESVARWIWGTLFNISRPVRIAVDFIVPGGPIRTM